MRRWVLIVLLWASPLSAQPLVIHGHPQKTVYTSPAEWPTVSGQGHWLGSGDADGIPCHVHIEPTFPIYAEISAPFVAPIQFQIFHCQGRLVQIWTPTGGGVVLDTFGEWREYVNIPGDPNGVVVLPGLFYFDSNGPMLADHGWTQAVFNARFYLDDGAAITQEVRVPFFSMRNPSAPEAPSTRPCDGCGPSLKFQNSVHSPLDPLNSWGAAIVQFQEMIPIAPLQIGQMWPLPVDAFGYGSGVGLIPEFSQRLDMNLHQFNSGTPLPVHNAIDTQDLGLGAHKVASIFTASVPPDGLSGFAPGEVASVLGVLPIAVVGDLPQPPAPVDCAQGDWYVVSTSDSYSDWIIVGDHQERIKTTTVTEQRDILTAPANGGMACGPSLQTTITTLTEFQPLPPPPPPPCKPRGKSGICK